MVQVNRKAARFYDAGMIDTFEVKSFLSPAECVGLRAELRQAAGSQATVLSRDPSGEVKPLVRRSTRMSVPARTAEQITALLMQQTDALKKRFGHALSSCEPPQFLRYLPGDFFVAHQDGNTPLIHDDSRFRKVSAVIFLSAFSQASAPESYGGGALVLAKVSGNTAVSFRANRRRASTGGARHATIISMSASRNGKPRIPYGCGRTARRRWRLHRDKRATASSNAP